MTRDLAWTTWPQAARLVLTGRTRRPALVVALVVGTVLSVVNQAEAVVTSGMDWPTAARIACNYAVPYVVSSIGLLSAHRVRRP